MNCSSKQISHVHNLLITFQLIASKKHRRRIMSIESYKVTLCYIVVIVKSKVGGNFSQAEVGKSYS